MIDLLAYLVLVVVLVVFHELGHYCVARLCNVKVLRFSVGFGNVLFAKHFGKGETEWAISAIPLGGYVKMLDEREGEVAPHELPRAFNRKPVLQRIMIVAAGPLTNLALAVCVYWALYMHGVPGWKPVLGDIPAHTPAAAAQFQPQETIVSVNGKAVPSWQELGLALLSLSLQRGQVQMEGRTTDGTVRQHSLDLSQLTPADLDGDFMLKLGLQSYQPPTPPVIGEVLDGEAGQRAGLQTGDLVKRIDGRQISDWREVYDAVRGHMGAPLQLDIVRRGQPVTIKVTPEPFNDAGKEVGRIGVKPSPADKRAFEAMLVEVSYPPLAALGEALHRSWNTAVFSVKIIAKMATGEVSLKNLSGPVTMAQYAGEAAQRGLGFFLDVLAFVSLSVGLLNLLPIPLLDGGHLLYYTAEFFKGGPVSERAWDIGQKIGAVLLVTLVLFVLYNDISRLILGHLQ